MKVKCVKSARTDPRAVIVTRQGVVTVRICIIVLWMVVAKVSVKIVWIVKEGGSVICAQKFFAAPIANTYIATKTGWKLALTIRMQ